jgi:hypothetical protein
MMRGPVKVCHWEMAEIERPRERADFEAKPEHDQDVGVEEAGCGAYHAVYQHRIKR